MSRHAVIWDIDGTLVDSNDQHAKAFEEAFEKCGFDVPFTKIRPLIGMGGEKLVPNAIGRALSEKKIEEINETKTRLFQSKYIDQVRPFPKVHSLFEELHKRQLKMAVATSAGKDELEKILDLLQIKNRLDVIVSADDVDHSKPDPDLLCAAQEKLKFSRSQIIMVGDTPYDIEAAHRAKIECIAFRCGGCWSDSALSGAIAIYDGPAHFLEKLNESPLFHP
jgi:HAD superfamily hydrolase (TIGR01549 family)